MQSSGAISLKTQKVLLSVGTDLDGGLGGNLALDGFPFAAVKSEGGQEALVLILGPVLTTFGQDILLSRSLRLPAIRSGLWS